MLIIARMEMRPRWHVLKMNQENTVFPIRLSPKQCECLRLIASGHTAASAALRMGISKRMVHYHLRITREKLGAVSTSQAVYIAGRLGFLDLA